MVEGCRGSLAGLSAGDSSVLLREPGREVFEYLCGLALGEWSITALLLLDGEKAWLKFSAAPLLDRLRFEAALELVDCDQRLRLSSPTAVLLSAGSPTARLLRRLWSCWPPNRSATSDGSSAMGIPVVRTAVPEELTDPGRLTVKTEPEEMELEREGWRCVREDWRVWPWPLLAPLLEVVLLAEREAVGWCCW